MAIEKNSFKVLRLESEMSSRSRESVSSEDDEFQRRGSRVESDDDDDEFDDCDSGAGSDDFDLLELGESGEEFCQVGDQTCSIPFELYDLPGLGDILSMDVWNECLTEEERFGLAKYLPDMDQESFMRSLKELFTGCTFHFGSPINKLFEMLKGGLCEPRVALYRQGLNFFQKRQHYQLLRKYQNSMVISLYQMREAWLNCRGYSIEEKLQVLNIMKSQSSLMCEKMEELETDSSERDESGDGLWSKRVKDRKIGLKVGRVSGHRTSPRQMAFEPTKFGKQNPKGTLKVAKPKTSTAKEVGGRFPSLNHGLEMKSGPYGSPLLNAAGYDSGAAVRLRDQIRAGGDDADDAMYEVAIHGDRNLFQGGAGKKYEGFSGEDHADSFMALPMSSRNDLHAFSRSKTVNQLSDIKVLTAKPSNANIPSNYGKKSKFPENAQQFAVDSQLKYGNARPSSLSQKGSRTEFSDGGEPVWHGRAGGDPFSVDPSSMYGDWNVKIKKGKIDKNSSDLKATERFFSTEFRAKTSQEKARVASRQNGGRDLEAAEAIRMFTNRGETESDSSEQIDQDDDDDNPLMKSKWAFPSGADPKKAKFSKKAKNSDQVGEHLHMAEGENRSLRSKEKGKMHDIGHWSKASAVGLQDNYLFGRSNEDDNREETYRLGRNGQLQGEQGDRIYLPSVKSYTAGRRQKGEDARYLSVPHSTYMHKYIDAEDDSFGRYQFPRENGYPGRLGKKGQAVEAYADDRRERSDLHLLGYNSMTKKRKLMDDVVDPDEQNDNDYLLSSPQLQVDDITSSKKRGKRNLEDENGTFEKGSSDMPVTELAVEDLDLESKPQKKPFILITPTVHTGFSFSIIHLLSAVRMAMITVLPEDSLDTGKHDDTNDGKEKLSGEQDRKEGSNGTHLHSDLDINTSGQSGQANVPSLTVQEIVNRVRSNPGDPCILETQEPLQDLVRGVLKIFSSKTAPLGAKGWKALVFYEKTTKSWSWIGSVPQSSSDQEAMEEVTSSDAWGLPHKMLVKLVDAFANWLKSGQETLQQIGSLPAPPLTLMQLNLDEKERFRDLRAQKSLNTINSSSEEVRDYFRKEEVLRYSIPDRAFSYTAVDGKKSIVAPLRRCGGKPTSKARDHFMLKRDRPPHVTILCLVRDAAARLPGSIGTRADVCTLIRDSQYIVEDVSDSQVNQVVSGALDRLHYERDPCVQFDGERKLWVYLHREREEEDFDDDGTSSTKKWKRQKKEAAEPSEQGTVTVAYQGSEEQPGFDLSSDLNAEPSCGDEDKRVDLVYYDGRHHVEDSHVGHGFEQVPLHRGPLVETGHGFEQGAMHRGPSVETGHGFEQGAMHRGPPMTWQALGLNPVQENGLLCQENSTNEDFDDEAFGREPPSELLSTSLS
ncbi:hypothetical protein RJ640_024999 [Escallonia rubra]|uniref:DEUBAD domain-containing protein n=1 Tax=Escallonia rubra TaxID=112253 RepID=A0AA88RMB0_9ASTE|nr:hypothetical protein RJ640_024999 [Escallonia rubra]